MPKKQTYEQLRDKWYAKLEKTGFNDIEDRDGHLKAFSHVNPDTKRRNQYNRVWRDSKEEYYRLATHFLNEYKFESRLEQIIWEYHAEGISAQKISETLIKAKVSKIKRSQIGCIIRALEAIMKEMYLAK